MILSSQNLADPPLLAALGARLDCLTNIDCVSEILGKREQIEIGLRVRGELKPKLIHHCRLACPFRATQARARLHGGLPAAMGSLPAVEGFQRDVLLPTELAKTLRRFRPLQNPENLLFGEPCALHLDSIPVILALPQRPPMEEDLGMELKIEALSAVLGARVEGLVVSELDARSRDTLLEAFDAHQVLFFPRQNPTPEEHKALASVFGEPEVHREGREEDRATAHYVDEEELILVIDSGRNASNFWHTDATFREIPPSVSAIVAKAVPPRGGDTLWLDTYSAFEELAPPVKELARGLRAVHGHPGVSELNAHPVVRTHPRTGREALWINRGWTTGLENVPTRQAQPLLRFFFDTMEQPEYTCRWSWSEGDVAVWDNRCTMHYALRDFGDAYREIHRITIAGAPEARRDSGGIPGQAT